MTEKEKPRMAEDQDRGKTQKQYNITQNPALKQVLSNERDGFRIYDDALLKGLAELAADDPIEFARRKPDAAKNLGVSQFDLDRLVQKVSRFPAIGEETRKPIQSVEIREFLGREFPPRVSLLNPWLPTQGLAMIYAPRGIGKTFFSLGVAYAVASAGSFLRWQAPIPQGVLFIDGEMPGVVLQERLAHMAVSCELEPQAPLRIITPDLQENGMLDLARADDQQELSNHLHDVSLIIIDNLSTLVRTGRENDAEGWLPIQAWALAQRAAGRSVLFVHHSGKGGAQRGTSRREDVLDAVINLRQPGDYTPDQGAIFEVHFEKARGIYGEDTKPFEAKLNTDATGHQEWTVRDLEQSTAERVAALLNDGIPQKEIPEMLGITKGAVSKAKKRAEGMGLIVIEGGVVS